MRSLWFQATGRAAARAGFGLALAVAVGCSDATVDNADERPASTDAAETTGRSRATASVFADLTVETPGCAVAVTHPGGEHLAAFGMADLENPSPVTDGTVFDLGSVSKQLTSGAIALLVADERLDLGADVTELLPDVGPFSGVVTVADLIHHTSGLPDYIGLLDADDDEVTTTDDALAALAADGSWSGATPGAGFQYSNTNYLLLSEIVEAVDGRSLVEFSDEEIFEPLGMDQTAVRDDQGPLLEDQAQGYEPSEGGWRPVGSSWRQTGDGAVHATAEDLLAWMRLFVDSPAAGSGLGSEAWLEPMTAPGPSVDDDGGAYAGGLFVSSSDDGAVLSHAGSWIGYASATVVAPEAGVGVAVACNIDGLDAIGRAEEILDIWTSG